MTPPCLRWIWSASWIWPSLTSSISLRTWPRGLCRPGSAFAMLPPLDAGADFAPLEAGLLPNAIRSIYRPPGDERQLETRALIASRPPDVPEGRSTPRRTAAAASRLVRPSAPPRNRLDQAGARSTQRMRATRPRRRHAADDPELPRSDRNRVRHLRSSSPAASGLSLERRLPAGQPTRRRSP